MTDTPTNERRLISITIRPPKEEFERLAIPMAIFIQYVKDCDYLISLESGLNKGQFNHYQIALITEKHIDTIRRMINKIFKPYLSPSTLKKAVWKKVIKHNNKVSLLGYCQKEGHVYSTNIDQTILDEELYKYCIQTKDKKPIKRRCECKKRFCICEHSFYF